MHNGLVFSETQQYFKAWYTCECFGSMTFYFYRFKIAVAMPNLDELLKDTPTHIFASVWFEWRKTKYFPIHYSELIRLAALYK